MEHRFVPITEFVSIPVPKDCTKEEEEALVAQFLKTHDLAELEAEYKELANDIAEGNFVPIEQVMQELGIEDLPIEGESA